MATSYLTAFIRTIAGYLVSLVVSLPVMPALERTLGVDSATAKAQLTGLFVFILGTVYYAAARAIEHRWPRAGILLGIAARPVYVRPKSKNNTWPDLETLAEAVGAQVVDGDPIAARHAA